jgi:hypothetical protein
LAIPSDSPQRPHGDGRGDVLLELLERAPGDVRFDSDEIALLMGDAAARVLKL